MVESALLSHESDALQQALQPSWPGLRVQWLASVDSTSTRLLERLRAGERGPWLLAAVEQTQGRGRNGRTWSSRPGASLTFSIGAVLDPADWSGLSLAVGVALADAIEPPDAGTAPRLQLKWPNDLWLADGPASWRKLGGVLVETVAVAGRGRGCVLGVGLNVAARDDVDDLASGYASVSELRAGVDDRSLLADVAPALVAALRRFERDGLSPFVAGWRRRDLLAGREVTTSLASGPRGVAEGIDARGALLLRTASGVVPITSGEVGVRPQR